MRYRPLLAALALPIVLACAGLPGGLGTKEPTPEAPTADAITDLDAAVAELGAAVSAVEAVDPATLDATRMGGLRDRLRGVIDSLQFAVERAVAKPAPAGG